MPASSAAPARQAAGALVGAALAALGALIVGEYELTAAVVVVGGTLFGLAVAEAVVWVVGERSPALGVEAAVLSAAGLLWAGWIASSEGLRPFPATAWPMAAIGAVVAGWRAGRWRRAATD